MITSSTADSVQYWEQFSIQPSDLDHLMGFLVEKENPFTVSELAQEITRYRQEQINALLKQTLSQGRIYRPGESFTTGETVIFPHLQNQVGEVTAIREGHNPEYEPFTVINVKMEDGEKVEFITELSIDHPLNNMTYLPDEEVDTKTLFKKHGKIISKKLSDAFQVGTSFVNVANKWFVRDLLVEVSTGQLNLAEALLDMEGGGPLRTEAFLSVIELPAEIPVALQLFSLEYALLNDRRFDEVGPAGYALWYLRTMEPKPVVETPKMLSYIPIPYNRGMLDDVMLNLISRVQDEWSELDDQAEDIDQVTIILSYPHWRSGTLPLAAHVTNLFPTAHITDRIRFSFVDGQTGDIFPGWVVRSGRYVYGLHNWYLENKVGVGSYIDLQREEEPGQITVSFRPLRSRRREWLRTATVVDRELALEVVRVPVACEFDELTAMAIPEPATVDALAMTYEGLSLEVLTDRVFDGLAGLSLQRAVHAMTLYSVINLVRRVPPGPILATLAQSSKYISLGDNYWAYRGGE
ncbi:MAG: hypothetical protein P1S60_13600 [Anaerolineae bacterium]|nr:hypothetical protein [Anaerolineae bacterium]